MELLVLEADTGIAGCGKTVLRSVTSARKKDDTCLPNPSSTVLEYIWKHCTDTQPDAVVIYYYFDFNDYTKRNTRLFVNYVLYNLCRRHPESFAELQKQYEAAINTSKRLSWDTATKLIHQTISRLPKTYIIVDALDECQDREPLLQFLRDLSISNRQQLHILATSRECDITERLKSHLTQKVDIKSAVVDRDIELYIAHLLKTDELLQKWRNISIEGKEAFKYIEDGLMKKADGMYIPFVSSVGLAKYTNARCRFRWVYCQIELIKKCKTPTKLQETLRGLPKTLDETYKRIIDAIIDEDEQTSAVRVLQWLCYSQRPLTLSEIVDALAVTPGLDGCFRPADRLVDPSDLTAICTSLITISDSKKGTAGPQVRLAHYSVQEYLLSERCKLGEFQPQRSNLEMAETCLQYLLHACRQPRHAVASEDGHNSLPLYSYSSTSWFNHVKLADPQKSTAVIDVAMRELFSQPEVFETWAAITRPGPRAREDKNLFSPLYYASWIGIPEIVQQLIMKGAKPDKVETVNGDMVPDCNLQCKVLDVAVAEGHLDVVRILLRAGADPNATGDGWGSPLQVASFRGLEAIVQVLLESGADATAHTGTNGTGFALHAAAEKGHPRIVKLLLDHGADPNQTGSDSGNALNAAALCGNKESVRELLKAGADPHVQTDEGNALQYAAEGGNVKVVQLLLDEGVDVNQVTENVAEHATALQAAAHEGHEGVVRLLLQHGADVNGPPGCSGSALRAAFAGCNSATVDAAYEAIINLLQDHNASDMPPRPQPAIRNRVMGRGAPAPLPPAEGLNMI